MGQIHGEVSQGTTFRIGRVLAQTLAAGDLRVNKMGLVMLPLDSAPKVAVGQ